MPVSAIFDALMQWSVRNWLVAAASSIAALLLIAIPTAMIENPIFGRAIAVTSWSWPVLIITSVLAGLLIGSYVKTGDIPAGERPVRFGTIGGMLGFFAVGCPVCNKLVLLALGSSGALNYFAPIQPYLAAVGLAFLAYALGTRLQNQQSCKLPNSNQDFYSTTQRRKDGDN